MDNKNIEDELRERAEYAEEIIKIFNNTADEYNGRVVDAMNYSVNSGGKRLRPLIMMESYYACGGSEDHEDQLLDPFMGAIELIHTYSLVHDDLPAMDNDEYRRGKKTTHVVYGAGFATLAGDGLLNMAYEVLSQTVMYLIDEPELMKRAVRAMNILADKSGIYGMVGGQSADLEAEYIDDWFENGGEPNLENAARLQYIHEHKTSALIQAALMCGAVLAGAPNETVDELEEAGRLLGLAFQIKDDILDMEGDEEKLGKPVHSDEKNGKCTYISIFGMEKAKEDCDRYSGKAAEILAKYVGNDGFLERLAVYLTRRES